MATLARIRGPSADLLIGHSEPVRIMALVGTTSRRDERMEAEKVHRLVSHHAPPDVVADLSLRTSTVPLWRRILAEGMPAATLPIYTAASPDQRIDRGLLLARAVEQVESGVGMITIHPTATKEIIAAAQRDRSIPWTSRGGGIVIRDLQLSEKTENAYLAILPELATLAARHSATISIGSTFRSATVFDANDHAQNLELLFQAKLAAQLKEAGCSVIIEGPGHAAPSAIKALAKTMMLAGCPIMPLGPIPTDLAIGQDHISAAIGATLLGLEGAAHIIAAVTREEHTGGVPSILSTLEAVDAAHVAARVIDLHWRGPGPADLRVMKERSEYRTCVAGQKTAGCSRCGTVCPL